MGIYMNTKASLLKYCKDFCTRNGFDFDVFDFDAHATINELPDNDLIGIGEFSMENNSQMYIVTCMIGVCTKADDQNLTRLSPAIDKLFNELQPDRVDNILEIVTADVGEKTGQFKIINPIAVLPVARNAKARPFQTVAVSLAATFS